MGKFGEPLKLEFSNGSIFIRNTDGKTFAFKDIGKRMVECTNACAGMEDPEKEIQKLREALAYIRDMLSEHYDPFADDNDTSPDDSFAHINGLCIKRIDKLLKESEASDEPD